MRLNEIICENSSEQQILIDIANKFVERWIVHPGSEDLIKKVGKVHTKIGSLRNIAGKETLGPLDKLIGGNRVFLQLDGDYLVTDDGKLAAGIFHAAESANSVIELCWPPAQGMQRAANVQGIGFLHPAEAKTQIKSTMVHELRHALDWAKSARRATGNERTSKGTNKQSKDYQGLTGEINARFSEAMITLKRQLDGERFTGNGSMGNEEDIMDTIRFAFNEAGLIAIWKSGKGDPNFPLNNKGFRRLVVRALNYANAHAEHNKEGEAA